MGKKYDFSGWATRNDLVCSDGRTIRRDAFKDCDGKTVPLVWNHQHNDPTNVLGHALLENRKDGVYAYCSFNDSESGQAAKMIVRHGDVESLSIYANGLKQDRGNVMHGTIREVSLVVAGANPGAFIDFVDMAHGDGMEQEVIICPDEPIYLAHANKPKDSEEDEEPEETDETKQAEESAKPAEKPTKPEKAEDNSKEEPKKMAKENKTVKDVFDTLTEEQKTVVYALIGAVLEENQKDSDDDEGGNRAVKHNVFDAYEEEDTVLSHADQGEILAMAKMKTVGSLQSAVKAYCEQHGDVLEHGYDDIEALFPDYEDTRSGAPELLTRDQGWVTAVMSKVHKSPISRIRTKQVDARADALRSYGWDKSKKKEKKLLGNMKLLKRTTDPQTIYVKDALNRDDIIDITDFDVVQYQYGIMRQLLNEEIAIAIMVGDGREDGEEDKISEDHVRSIWNDDDLYTIHHDIDIEATRTDIGEGFSDNYVYSEAVIAGALYAREDYKGTGTPDFYCTPHLLNMMLLAKDKNGRRIYSSKSDIAAALDVKEIYTAEQFEKLVRTDKDQGKHQLLGIFVNLADYTVGSTKGGEITRFNQFDIDFNQEKYLIESRLSGALTRVYSAVALEQKQDP